MIWSHIGIYGIISDAVPSPTFEKSVYAASFASHIKKL